MKAVVLLFWLSCGIIAAQEAEVFTPPQAYSLQRYEPDGSKNPFTLKTAPPVVEQVSFAQDLAIGTYYGDSEDPTVVIVNTKTGERFKLKKGQPAANGMQLNGVKLGSSRKDIAAELVLGSETNTVFFNDSYLKQMASAETVKLPPGQSSGTPAAGKTPTPPGQQPRPAGAGGAPPTAPPRPAGPPQGAPGRPATTAFSRPPVPMPATAAAATKAPAGTPSRPVLNNTPPAAPTAMPSGTAGGGRVPIRRRLVSLPAGVPAAGPSASPPSMP